MYTYTTTVRLHHTDAAGILFFAHLFVIVHKCYGLFLEPEVTFNSIFNEQNLKMQIVHTEADYYKPLRTSEKPSSRNWILWWGHLSALPTVSTQKTEKVQRQSKQTLW